MTIELKQPSCMLPNLHDLKHGACGGETPKKWCHELCALIVSDGAAGMPERNSYRTALGGVVAAETPGTNQSCGGESAGACVRMGP
eukprot:1161852-Pelagomonas_calceolata.AAC.8